MPGPQGTGSEMICLQNLAKERVSEGFMAEPTPAERLDVIPFWVLMTLFISITSIENNNTLFLVYPMFCIFKNFQSSSDLITVTL